MKASRAFFVVLQVMATLFMLGPIVGFLVTLYGMIVSFQTLDGPAALATAVASRISFALSATSIGLLLFPIGVCLQWLIVHKTGMLPSLARQAMFVGSIFACLAFPLGTVIGVVAIYLLVRAEAFRRHKEKLQS
jgi:hypothetical protein